MSATRRLRRAEQAERVEVSDVETSRLRRLSDVETIPVRRLSDVETSRRTAEDTAVVLAVIAALRAQRPPSDESNDRQTLWGATEFTLTGQVADTRGWWASGMPR